jgi:hypothetical protein
MLCEVCLSSAIERVSLWNCTFIRPPFIFSRFLFESASMSTVAAQFDKIYRGTSPEVGSKSGSANGDNF